jgi:DNA (cytosine-5)-methyltransferase 1
VRAVSLCTGYGGLDIATEAVLGTETVALAEFDKHASRVCGVRFPGVPNLGDITKIDWSTLEEIDVLTAGYPCQPFSTAGKRKGESDSRHIWPYIAEGVRRLRPRLVILENVSGHRSKGFGAVLGDLAEARYDVQWTSVRASDVGAPHRRDRVFIVASSDAGSGRCEGYPEPHGRAHEPGLEASLRDNALRLVSAAPDAPVLGLQRGGQARRRGAGPSYDRQPAPDANGAGRQGPGHHSPGRALAARGHVPASSDPGSQRRVGWPGELGDRRDPAIRGEAGDNPGYGATAWGQYEPAIRRWERLTRPAPEPRTPEGSLSPLFVEWMMGLPSGWVTDVGLPKTQALKILGNGVVPQQAERALRSILDYEMEMAA